MLRDDQKQKTSSDLKSWTGYRYLNAYQSWKFIPKILWLTMMRLKGDEKATIGMINDPVKTHSKQPRVRKVDLKRKNPSFFWSATKPPNPRRFLVVRRDNRQEHKSSYWFLEGLWNKRLHNKLYMKIREDMSLGRGQNKYNQMVFKGSNLNSTLLPFAFPSTILKQIVAQLEFSLF